MIPESGMASKFSLSEVAETSKRKRSNGLIWSQLLDGARPSFIPSFHVRRVKTCIETVPSNEQHDIIFIDSVSSCILTRS